MWTACGDLVRACGWPHSRSAKPCGKKPDNCEYVGRIPPLTCPIHHPPAVDEKFFGDFLAGFVKAGHAPLCPIYSPLPCHATRWTWGPGGSSVSRPGYVAEMAEPDTEIAPVVEVRRSRRRRRTVAAYRDGGKIIVLIPARMSKAEERHWVSAMLERLQRQDRRRRPNDDALLERARDLSERYLDGRAKPTSVRWVTNQNTRWGSCTPADASVRLSTRLQGMPQWVVDYVLVHELAHLLEAGHTDTFWSMVAAFPKTERARGYLEGIAHAAGLPLADDTVDSPDQLEPGRPDPDQDETVRHALDREQPAARKRKRRRSAPDQDQLPFDSSQAQ
jgi:predicted metal-dependent hydrolase